MGQRPGPGCRGFAPDCSAGDPALALDGPGSHQRRRVGVLDTEARLCPRGPGTRQADQLLHPVTREPGLDQVVQPPYSSGMGVAQQRDRSKGRGADPGSSTSGPRRECRVSSTVRRKQAKVVMAREMSRELRVLVASQPTREVDVGSIEFMQTHRRRTWQGAAVLIINAASWRIGSARSATGSAVMYRGTSSGWSA